MRNLFSTRVKVILVIALLLNTYCRYEYGLRRLMGATKRESLNVIAYQDDASKKRTLKIPHPIQSFVFLLIT